LVRIEAFYTSLIGKINDERLILRRQNVTLIILRQFVLRSKKTASAIKTDQLKLCMGTA